MKKITAIIILLLATHFANAKCASSGIYSVIKGTTLNKNGLLIMEFYGSSQSLIPELNKKYAVYFIAGKTKIRLDVTEVLKGDFSVSQVIFKPATALEPTVTYEFFIEDLPNYESNPTRYNVRTLKAEPMTFLINDFADTNPPLLTSIPVEFKKTLVQLGCGPATWVWFKLAAADRSEILVRTSVKNKSTGKITEYILPLNEGSVTVGHGMCSGGFTFIPGAQYEVSFTLIDLSGNATTKTTAISFTPPVTETSEE